MASILAATAAPFVAAGEPKQEALERALDLVEAAVAFIESQRERR